MTPQDLSIADLKAVIDYVDELDSPPDKFIHIRFDCRDELHERIRKITNSTEPKKEERK